MGSIPLLSMTSLVFDFLGVGVHICGRPTLAPHIIREPYANRLMLCSGWLTATKVMSASTQVAMSCMGFRWVLTSLLAFTMMTLFSASSVRGFSSTEGFLGESQHIHFFLSFEPPSCQWWETFANKDEKFLTLGL